MPTIATSISQTSDTCLKDKTAPAKLGIEWAKYGNFNPIRGGNRIDPLVLNLTNVEPNCTLEVLALSDNPAADWKKDGKKMPANLARPICDGKYSILMGNKDAAKVGLKSGDVFAIRQVDAAGNASEPVMVKLDQKAGAGSWNRVNLDNRVRDDVGAGLPPGQYNFMPDGDSRAPVALPKRLKIEAAKKGMATLSCDRAVEPGARIIVENARLRKPFQATVDDNGQAVVKFEAEAGDPLHIKVADHNNVVTDLGVTTYAPTCVKAGPGAQHQLQDQGSDQADSSGQTDQAA